MTESDSGPLRSVSPSDGQMLTCKFDCLIHGIDAGCGKRLDRRPPWNSVFATVAMCAECYNGLCRDSLCGCRVCRDSHAAALAFRGEARRFEKKPAIMKKPVVKKKPVSSSATMPKKPRSVNKPASSSATNHKTPTTMKKPAASPAASGEAK